jgi:Tol biopolymer transport system component
MKIIWLLVGCGLIALDMGTALRADLPLPAAAPSRANVTGAGGSFLPVLSEDGRYIAFVSSAHNLVDAADSQPCLDVFVRDLLTGTTLLVSVNTNNSSGGHGDSNHPSISADGRWIAFESEAEDLVTNDFNHRADVFVRDLATGRTTLASVNAQGTASGNSFRSTAPCKPIITPDGRWIVFESIADDLVNEDDKYIKDIFARDWQSGTMVLVSAGAQRRDVITTSSSAAPTPDARRIAFVSTTSNLVHGVYNLLGEIYVHDLAANFTYWASTNLNNYPSFTNGYRCFNPAISADGRFVAFKAASSKLPDQVWVFRHDLETGQSLVITTNSNGATWPVISTEGRWVACEIDDQLYLCDVHAGTNLLLSVNAAGTGRGNSVSHTPVLAAAGKAIAFLSAATDLVSDPAVPPESGFQVYVRDLVAGTTCLASVGTTGLPSRRSLETIMPSINADGQRVAFDSPDATLVPDDLNQASDVFVRDLAANTTQLVSRRAAGLPERTSAAPSVPEPASLSADGRYVAFLSYDSNLVPDDTNRLIDVLVQDMQTGTTLPGTVETSRPADIADFYCQLILSGNGQCVLFFQASAPRGGIAATNYHLLWRDLSRGITEEVDPNLIYQLPADVSNLAGTRYSKPAISSDGRWVAYFASSTNVYPPKQLFLRDMMAHTNLLLSTWGGCRDCATLGANNFSINPVFSPDNRWVVFQSSAGDLTTNNLPNNYYAQLYAKDLASGNTWLLNVNTNGKPLLLGLAGPPTVNASSRYVVFQYSDNKSYLYDLQTHTVAPVCTECLNPSLSADGLWLAYQRLSGYLNRRTDLFLKDLQTGAETLVATNYAGSGSTYRDFLAPRLSADGRFTVFASAADNLVANDTNKCFDVFLNDRVRGTLLALSRSLHSVSTGNGYSGLPVMSADGRTVAFQSAASDLVAGDYNDAADVFIVRLYAEDSDNDGLPDDWEVAYFGDLGRDGLGDYDGDGLTDRQEYLAGTDPTNKGSVLQVVTITPVSGGPVTLLWSAVPGKNYKIQYKNDVNYPWTELPDAITAASTTASALDATAAQVARRFYRVVLVP